MISSGLTLDPSSQHIKSAKCKGKMQDVSNQGSSRLKPKRAKGESIEMHGGRIVRSAGRKDRHSKVCTARGPRDRRVRLSPNTAIQFYDVQDRLGYDRPSKAIDWLMQEAKAAIDALDHDSNNATTNNLDVGTSFKQPSNPLPEKGLAVQEEKTANCSKSACGIDSQDYMNGVNSINNFSFYSMDNGDIHPTSSTGFHDHTYPHVGDLGSTSRNIKSQTQGLSLSFHTVQDFSFLCPRGGQQGLIPPASVPSHCDSETSSEIARCQRIFVWDSTSDNVKGSQESLVNSLPLHFPSPFDQNQLLFHREPLQSSFSSPIRGPLDNQFPNLCFSGTRISNNDGLSELSAAARIQGPEEQNPISWQPSSATSLLEY